MPVAGGFGQIDCDGCAACWTGAAGGGAGQANCPPCCDGAVGGGAGQAVCAGCCAGVPDAPTSIRVGVDGGGASTPAVFRFGSRATATAGLGFGFDFASGFAAAA